MRDSAAIIALIADIFERRGAEDYLGEAVTMAEHMLQTAALAEAEQASDELVAAALLHDIGHFTSEFGSYTSSDTVDRYHDRAGAQVLSAAFPARVVEAVRLHVAAKRYLCAVDPDYYAHLSPASQHSLALQGGPMDADAIASFRREPFYEAAVQVRRWDDRGKIAGLTPAPFGHFRPLLERLVASTAADRADHLLHL
jgi:phosphonate degradation associated HDIG domain protein